ncbi:heparanase-like [Thrips palmi]|uniref:Heparanase-like n=1 Tax=Thrips palmi TaxID=161013 RepID=A0A6P9AGJ3_THRPL|nr:heparanase-like [Thrips palmi]
MDFGGLVRKFALFAVLCCVRNWVCGEIVIDTHERLCEVSKNFLSVAVDTNFIFKHDLTKFLGSATFMNILSGLRPAYLRIGGTAADTVIFDETFTDDIPPNSDGDDLSLMANLSWNVEEDSCISRSWPDLYLSGDRWLAINAIASKAKLNLLFDLNVLLRKTSGEWNSTNAQKLIEFSQENNLLLDWQLGNEPNSFCHVFGKQVPPRQLAKDFKTLSRILSKFPHYHKSKLVGPDITAPRGPKKRQAATLRYLDRFMAKAGNTISAASWHQYYFSGRNATVEEFIKPSMLDVLKREILDVKAVVINNTDAFFPVWLTETASAFGGGSPHLSNRFVSGFMWLDKLGMAASQNVSVVIRQSFIGGNYGLIHTKSFDPTPNYWIAYLYKKIVGKTVLKVKTTSGSLIRLYAHCYKKHKKADSRKNSIVIFGMNLGHSNFKDVISKQGSLKKFHIEKYILTGANDQLTSRDICLNGEVIKMSPAAQLPALRPRRETTNTIELPPHSMAFYVIRGFPASACS